ncbi:MAG: hypothetical protein ABI210_01185 [Abditibacteriaceae bacterium]
MQDKTLPTVLPDLSAQLTQLTQHRESMSASQDRVKKVTIDITGQQKAIEEFARKLTKAKEHLTTIDEKRYSQTWH